MGWASYNEDNVSRWNANRFGQSTRSNKPAPAEAGDPDEPQAKGNGTVSELGEFTMSSARPLPVIILADVSGSMSKDGKISVLNDALAEMIKAFGEEDDSQAEIHVSVVTFGGDVASIHEPLRPARELSWEAMEAAGRTPMGGAFELVRSMLESRETVPSRAYRPTLVLVSDGVPTDEWKPSLQGLLQSERASKAMRFAMAIGDDADHSTLGAFLAEEDARVFQAHEAREIRKFFRWVTMSVTSRTQSSTPNSVIKLDPAELDDIDF